MSIEATTLPTEDRIAVISATTTADTTNLAAAGQLGTLTNNGLAFEITTNALVYFKLGFADQNDVDKTATSGSTRGWPLQAGETKQFYFETRTHDGGLNTFLSLEADAGTAVVRVASVGRKKG